MHTERFEGLLVAGGEELADLDSDPNLTGQGLCNLHGWLWDNGKIKGLSLVADALRNANGRNVTITVEYY